MTAVAEAAAFVCMMILDVLFSGVTGYFLIDFVRALRAFILDDFQEYYVDY